MQNLSIPTCDTKPYMHYNYTHSELATKLNEKF